MEEIAFPIYAQYKDSGVDWLGEIPSHWSLKKSKFLWKEIDDRSIGGEEQLLSVSQYSGVVPKEDNSRSDSLEGYKICKKDDLVVNIMLAWMSGLGVSSYDGIVSPAYCVYRQLEKHNARYFNYLYRTPIYLAEFARRSLGIVPSRWRMYTEDFGQVITLLPPCEEQDRIANFLDRKTAEIDEAIAKKQRLIELLKEQKAILINQAVTKGLNPDAPMRDSGVEWIGKVPEHWSTSRIGFVAEVGNGSTPNRGTPGYWYNGDIPWLNSSKVNDGVITEADQFVTKRAMKECHLPTVSPGSIVVAITGEGKTRGMAALCQLNATINQHLAYIRIRDERLVPEYLVLYLQGMYDWLRYESSSNGSTKGAITCSDIKKYMLPLPPVQEQQEIVIHVERWTREWADLMEKTGTGILQLEEFKTVIVAQAVTGKIKL